MHIIQEERKRAHVPNRTKHRLDKALESCPQFLGRERNPGFIQIDVEEREDIPQLRRFMVQEWDIDHLRAQPHSKQLNERGQFRVEGHQLSKHRGKAGQLNRKQPISRAYDKARRRRQ